MANNKSDILIRVEMILKDKQMSELAFAKEIGVPQRTLNGNLRGVSKPSVELMTKILDRYPEISAEWLFRGTGEMYLYKQCDEGGGGSAPCLTNEDINKRLQSLQDELNNLKERIC